MSCRGRACPFRLRNLGKLELGVWMQTRVLIFLQLLKNLDCLGFTAHTCYLSTVHKDLLIFRLPVYVFVCGGGGVEGG